MSISRLLKISALFSIICAETCAANNNQKFLSYEDVAASDVPATVLFKVIARDGKSKRYDDLISLDGGTVGIAHFAVGGLSAIYLRMDTKKYFNKTNEEMVSNFSSACRPKGKSGDDTGWGCFSKAWWHSGMAAFLASAESKKIQNDAWAAMMRPVVEVSLLNGWVDSRSIAISLGIANSLGLGGFTSLAKTHKWNPERVLNAYVGLNKHRQRRRQALDDNFPRLNN